MLRAVLIGQLHDLSLRELETELSTNLLVRWFTGYHLFEPVPDHSTLGRFEGWLIVNQPRIYFESILKQVKQNFPEAAIDTQIGDTYAMEADAALHGVVEMLRKLSLRLLESWRETNADFNLLRGFDWVALFGVFPEKHPGRMSDKEKAMRLQKTVLAVQDLHKRLSHKAKGTTQLWLDYIQKVIHDFVEIKPLFVIMAKQTSPSDTTSRSRRQKTASSLKRSHIPGQHPIRAVLLILFLNRKSHPKNSSTMLPQGQVKYALMFYTLLVTER